VTDPQASPAVTSGAAVDGTSTLIARLAAEGRTIAVAESLTGGALTAELTRPAGASAVVVGGVVVYATELKHTLVDVDAAVLAEHGPVHPEVARQLARGVRRRLAVAGRPADFGVATTGVAGPEPQGGRSVGTVFVGVSWGDRTEAIELQLRGDRASIRAQTVSAAVAALLDRVVPQPVDVVE
jgi:nicotinamide-nucleotide amidase